MSRRIVAAIALCVCACLAVLAGLAVTRLMRLCAWCCSGDAPLVFVHRRSSGISNTAEHLAAKILGENPKDRMAAANGRIFQLYVYFNKEPGTALPVVDAGPNPVLYSSVIWSPVAWADGLSGTYFLFARCLGSAANGGPPDTVEVRLNFGDRVRTITLDRDVPDLDGSTDVTIYSNHWARRGPYFVPAGSCVSDPGRPEQWTWASLSADAQAENPTIQGALVQPTPDFLATYRARRSSEKIAMIAGWGPSHRPGASITATIIYMDGSKRRLDFDRRHTTASNWRLTRIDPVKPKPRVHAGTP